MLNYLEQLRKKPLHYRKRFLFLSTTVITLIIFLVWLSTFNFSSSVSPDDSAAVASQLKPIDEIKTNIVSFYETVKKIGGEIFGGTATSS